MPQDARAGDTVERVLPGGMPSFTLRRTCACGGSIGPEGECAACRAKRQALQRRLHTEDGRRVMPAPHAWSNGASVQRKEDERPGKTKSTPQESPKLVSADVSKAIRTACDERCGPLVDGASYGETECEFGGDGNPTGTVLVTVTDPDPCTRPCVDKHEATHAVHLTPVCSQLQACTKKAGKNEAALSKCEDTYVTTLYTTAPGTECAAYKAEIECLRGRQSRSECASKEAKARLAKRLRGAECYRECFCTAVATGSVPKRKR
jgi:hypothetical protein